MSEVDVQLLTRLGAPITGLPDADVQSIHWVLSESGDATFTIDPFAPGADQIKQWDTEVQIWLDGDLSWWGIPVSFQGGPTGVTVNCEGIMSWLKKRCVDTTTLMYGDAEANQFIEQFTIGWNLVAFAQSESGQGNRDLNINAAAWANSGVQRSAIYKRSEHKFIYDILQEFRTFYQGFEFEIVTTGDGGRFWTPYYPRKGQARPNFHVIWNQGEQHNLSAFTWQEGGMEMCTQDYNTGGTVQGQRIEEVYEDVEASSRHGVLQAVTSSGSQLDRGWLQAQARGEVDKRKEPITTIGVTSARTDDITMLGVLETGDWIPVTIDCGMIQEDDMRRVTEITWTPNDALTLVFGEVVAA